MQLCIYIVPILDCSELFVESGLFPAFVTLVGVTLFKFRRDLWCQTVWHCMRDSTFSRLVKLSACD